MKKSILAIAVIALAFHSSVLKGQATTSFLSPDKVKVTADWYKIDDTSQVIILCHQEESSRGEYIQTAKRFNKLGFNCLAVDLRIGAESNGVANLTAPEIKSKKKSYLDAEKDILAAIEYVYSQTKKKIILLGSSYSASLVLKIAKENEKVGAVIALSPGEYFGKKLSVKKVIDGLDKPVFVASSKQESAEVTKITEGIKSDKKVQFIPPLDGASGSKALQKATPGSQDYWMALLIFSKTLKEIN